MGLWQRSGRLEVLLQRLAEDLRDRGKFDLSRAFVDAAFGGAKKGGAAVGSSGIYELTSSLPVTS